MKIIFIADLFVEDGILGGGELNNEEFIRIADSAGHDVTKINSRHVTPRMILENKDAKFIVANFVQLNEETKTQLTDNANYIIYEHDHKYLPLRDPAKYPNYRAPKDRIINYDFYKNAKAVLCQSTFHANIARANLDITNIHSVGGNLWSTESLKKLQEMCNKSKQDKCSVMQSNIPHKNTIDAVRFCDYKKWDYDLIQEDSYLKFLELLGANDKFVFFPQTPETLSRVVVEARMMGMKVITNDKVGASQEPWFEKKGDDLIKVMKQKRIDIPNMVFDFFQGS